MQSYQDQYTQCQDLAQDTSAGAKTFFQTNINLGQRLLESELGSFLSEETDTDLTEASVATYPTPDLLIRLQTAYVTVDDVRYVLEEMHDEHEWQRLVSNQTQQTSDTSTHIMVRRDRYEIYPIPATAGNTITIIHEAGGKDLSADDYTTGTITTLTNGTKAVVASGSTFTAAMVGRYFKINAYPLWYKIAAFTDATNITLDKEYTGTSIAAGTEAFTIGEMPRTPAATHQIPIWYALMNYYNGFKQNEAKAAIYKGLYESDLARAKVTEKRRYTSNYIPGTRGIFGTVNPNHYPINLTT